MFAEKVMKITRENGEVLYLSEDMIVNITTDGTEFKKTYKNAEVVSLNEDEIEIDNASIPWEYIKDISVN